MKFKPKVQSLFKRTVALLTATTVSLSLATQALATTLADHGNGGTGLYTSSEHKVYGYCESNAAGTAWMIDVYVSTADDGTIDTSKESITRSVGGIKRIGGIFFNYNIPDATIMYSKSNTSLRNSFTYSDVEPAYRSSLCKTAFNLPLTTATTDKDDPFIRDRKSLSLSSSSDNLSFYVVQSEPCGLPTVEAASISYSTIKDIIESEQFTIDIVKNLREAMGNDILALSTLAAVNVDIRKQIDEIALKDKPASLPEEAKRAARIKACEENLYPDCDNPLVEWAVVVTPLAVYQAYKNNANAFWITKDNGDGNIEVLCSTETQTLSYIMDAPTAVMYNEITKRLFGKQKYIDKLTGSTLDGDYGIPYDYVVKGIGGVNSGTKITEWGQLRKEYGRLFYNLTGMAHIDPNEYPQHLLGIRSAVDGELRTDVQGQIYPPLANDWTSIASKGGITIALSEKGDPEGTPINYYIRTYKATEDQIKEVAGKESLANLTDIDKLNVINSLDLTYFEIKIPKTLGKSVATYDPKTDTNISGIPVAEQSLAEYKNTDQYTSFTKPIKIDGYGNSAPTYTKITNTLQIHKKNPPVKEIDVLSVDLYVEIEDKDEGKLVGARPDDRIKTMDVTQLITIDQNSTGQISIHKTHLSRT